ncbi:MAG: methionyl-tRNA formyltransferase [Peptococcaceae bacterium]|jgi:methionyl-tRNA formyltransferase|nr:methionyl-tRNA formyltransferase [Peptococcaceae bacterium]MBQ5668545.1 methionyl-tRNA formyltransferase [Peptococcaceae bacterium]
MRVVFMGTPDFAVQSLNALVDAGHEVTAVITQPDRPKGRGNKMAFPEVKTRALELGLPVHQPDSVKDGAFLELLKSYDPEVIVVVAFGRILPQAVLDLPPYGCVNVHGSLLPEYRGAAPIQRAVLDGRKETGVTTMRMDIGMDTGDMLMQATLPITDEDTTGTMFDKLAELGGKVLIDTLAGLENGTVVPVKQDDSKATHAARILKEDEVIRWEDSAEKIFCQIRGLSPAPGAYTWWNGERLKLWKARISDRETGKAPGTVVAISKNALTVQTGKGCLEVLELQPAGKKAMPAQAFSNGAGVAEGIVFGEIHE